MKKKEWMNEAKKKEPNIGWIEKEDEKKKIAREYYNYKSKTKTRAGTTKEKLGRITNKAKIKFNKEASIIYKPC